MGINKVQFQRGLSMAQFMERYGTEEKCHAAVVALRWPGGFVCPECGETRHCTFERKSMKRCWVVLALESEGEALRARC